MRKEIRGASPSREAGSSELRLHVRNLWPRRNTLMTPNRENHREATRARALISENSEDETDFFTRRLSVARAFLRRGTADSANGSLASGVNGDLVHEETAFKEVDTEPRRTRVTMEISDEPADNGKSYKHIFRKCIYGLVVLLLVTISWVGAVQCLKACFTDNFKEIIASNKSLGLFSKNSENFNKSNNSNDEENNELKRIEMDLERDSVNKSANEDKEQFSKFDAPFFVTWICSLGWLLFLPLWLLVKLALKRDQMRISRGILKKRGITLSQYWLRCSLFSVLWLLSNYVFVLALRVLGATEVLAVFGTNVCFVYLLSWVVLHHQFVAIRIVAIIVCNTGIALLAYMDGVQETRTLAGVLLAATSSVLSAIFRVMFRRIMDTDGAMGHVAIFMFTLGLCSLTLFWPVVILLNLFGVETLNWPHVPWPTLIAAQLLSFVANLLGNFGVLVTHESLVTLGFLPAIGLCAVLDGLWYDAIFVGMRLSGLLMIGCAFVLVLLPPDWPQLATKFFTWRRRRHRENSENHVRSSDLRTGYLGSRLRSPSGRVR